jgi:uncharacterized protein (DUF1501 family)
MNNPRIDRRTFMKSAALGAAALSTASFPLAFLGGPARAAGATSGSPTGRRLLILNLAGGFDPLAVLQPDIGALADARRGLFQEKLLPFNGQLGLTSTFPLLGELFTKSQDAVLHRVAHENATREHDIQERVNATGTNDRLAPEQGGGWVERLADANPEKFTSPLDVIDLANGHPTVTGGTFASANVNWQLQTFRNETLREVNALRDAKVFEEGASLIQTRLGRLSAQGSRNATVLSDALTSAVKADMALRMERMTAGTPFAKYPNSQLGGMLSAVETVFGQLGTQIAYVRADNFDTHDNQAMRIPMLFTDVEASLRAFRDNLEARGLWKDTIILTTTDFGREIKQNSSGGTDHGVGADTFVIGPSVAGGRVLGEDYTAAEFTGEKTRFLDVQINVQNVLREVVGALGYDPNGPFKPFAGQQALDLFMR